MTQEASVKKDTQRLQRAIVDGLEDVKAQDIAVFNTEHLSPLFERVIVASGTSNRQTKALAASVRDSVREAGFPKPRIEGEENGEWIIVDCGAAVAHIMQPSIRQYYHLEEIWGEKPVRLKFGAPKPMVAAEAPATAKKSSAKTTKKSTGQTATGQAGGGSAAKRAPRSASKTASTSEAKSASKGAKGASKAAQRHAPAGKSAAGKTPAKKAAAKKAPAKKSSAPQRRT